MIIIVTVQGSICGNAEVEFKFTDILVMRVATVRHGRCRHKSHGLVHRFPVAAGP
jgi:hypothetical protein